jgi:hypothetical protein
MSPIWSLFHVIWLAQSIAFGNALGVEIVTNLSEFGDGIFNFKESKEFVEIPEVTYPELNIFCYNGTQISVLNFWTSIEMRLKIDSDDYHLYMGRNVSMVKQMHEDHMSSWFYHVLPWKSQVIRINTFEPSCVGILGRDTYRISLLVKVVDYNFVIMTFIGLALFYYAKDLCRNVFFHYTSGVGVGIFLSLVVIIYFIQKRFNLWFGYAVCSYSLATYIITSIWYNMKTYLLEHYIYVLGYLVVTGSASFGICYRMGPVENVRTLNLIQWAMQFIGLVAVFCSSSHQAASLSMILGMLLWESTPAKMKTKLQIQYQLRIKKPKPKLLTEQEYIDQSQIETTRALTELRQYCKSPKCDAWKMTSRLTSPGRFAEFVAGSPHLTQEEILDYSHVDEFEGTDEMDNSRHPHMTDDESDESEIDLDNPYEERSG